MIKLCFKKLNEEAIIPQIKNEEDAGLDFHTVEEGTIFKGGTKVFSTGLSLAMEWDLPGEIQDFDYPEYAEAYYKTLNHDFCFTNNQWLMNHYTPYLHIVSRSGLATQGVHAGAGIIDFGYRGELKIILHNISGVPIDFNKGDRIAQGIIRFKPNTSIVEVEELPASIRGYNGFGSTGL